MTTAPITFTYNLPESWGDNPCTRWAARMDKAAAEGRAASDAAPVPVPDDEDEIEDEDDE